MNIHVIGKFYTGGFALHITETLVSMPWRTAVRAKLPLWTDWRQDRASAGSGS